MTERRILADPAVRRLAAELAALRRKVETLEAGSRASQLDRATLHGGRLMIRDDGGQVRGWLGRQPDGTFGLGAANGDPPTRPNTATLMAFPAGVAIGWNGELLSAVPSDLSHVLCYLSDAGPDFIRGPSNLRGTLTRAGTLPVPLPGETGPFWCVLVAVNTSGIESPPSLVAGPVSPGQVVASAVLDGIVDELALADDAVTRAKLAAAAVGDTEIDDDAVRTRHVVAGAIEALQLAVDSVTAGKVAADAITAREIAALAITAAEIAANAINAGHLQAGSVTAQKLAATLVLASRIILGDPIGARLEIDPFGIQQYDESNTPTTRLGQDPRGGNYLTVVDPDDPQKALASISEEGFVSASGFTVNGGLTYNGDDLDDLLLPKTNGLAGWGITTGNSPSTQTGVAWFEFEFIARPMRMYKVCSAPMVMKGTGGVVFLRYTTDGSAPTTSSRYITYCAVNNNDTFMFNTLIRNNTPDTVRYRVMLHVGSFTNNVIFIEDTNGDAHHQMWAEDIGPDLADSSRISNGATTSPPAPRRRTVSWGATWSSTWAPGIRPINDMVQGTFGGQTNRAAFGFDDANIRAQLAGATIHDAGLYLYSNHWYYSSGGFARIRTHNTPPVPSNYPGVSLPRWVVKMGKPQGLWINLGPGLGNEFRDNITKGFALDATDVAPSLNDYGRFDGAIHGGRPVLAIDFTK